MSTIDLTRLQNVRDVGHIAGIRPGVLYRSDAPHPGDATPDLEVWPPRHVVDLRSGGEDAFGGHPLDIDGTTVHVRPMLGRANPLALVAEEKRHTVTLEAVYDDLARVVAPFAVAVAELIVADDGPVLVHCSAGKDRTGVTVAALLQAVGVDRADIVADYRLTAPHVDGIVARMIRAVAPEHKDGIEELLTVHHAHLMGAPETAITTVLDRLEAAPGWLAPELEARLRERLIA